MATTTRRAAIGAIGSIAAAGIIAGQRAAASPGPDRSEWDKAWREYQDATAAYRADSVAFDQIDAAHTAALPSKDMIDWKAFQGLDRFHVLRALDLEDYRRKVIEGRHVWWYGNDAALARRMAAIDSVQRYRDAVAEVDRRFDYDALCARNNDKLEAMIAAEDRLMMHVPAPDHAALRWKLEKLLEVEADNSTAPWAGFYVTQTLADMRRLLGGEA